MSGAGDLRAAQKVTYAIPQLPLAIGGALVGQWMTYFYLPPDAEVAKGKVALVGAGVFAALMLAGRVVDAVADPLIGYWSDRVQTRLGRRLPFLLYGTPLLALSFAALWFPPFEPGSTGNGVWLGVALFLYWSLFTAVVAPYFALLPEIATTTAARVNLSSYMAVAMALGGLVAAIGIGKLQSDFPDGATLFGVRFDSGIQLFAAFATLTTFLFWAPLANIRERPHTERKAVPKGLFSGLLSAFKNKSFQTFLGIACFVQMGAVMMGAALPYLGSQVLERPEGAVGLVPAGQGEAWAGYLTAGLGLLALLWIPLINVFVARWGKKRVMVACGLLLGGATLALPALPLFADPAWPMIAIIVFMSLPVASAFVLPNAIYGDVVDQDELTTGVRREGIYTGAMAVIVKTSLGLANAAVVGLLTFGDSRDDPTGILAVGPAAAALVLFGTWIFSHHPVDD